ncbi:MAG: hypothetical protein AAFV19_10470 [Pseudomonadota bacterium]
MKIEDLEAGIAPETLADLRRTDIQPGRPVIAVDVDEVLVVFTDHLARYIETLGYEMRITTYELEGSMFPAGSDKPIPFDECIALINSFFAEEVTRQEAIPGGAEALSALAMSAQVVILTNAPRHGRDGRRQNLDALGVPYPLVVNSGGKGQAMKWLAMKAGAPAAFIDDSVMQIGSVARHAPEVMRIHFAWAPLIARLFPECADATCQVRDWAAAEAALSTWLTNA